MADSLNDIVVTLRAAGCVFAEDEADIIQRSARDDAETESFVARRVAGEPLEHVVGWAEFAGLRIRVGPGVFVPRRRTEFLAREAAGLAPDRGVVVELCCGAAAVSALIASMRPATAIYAIDDDPTAVEYARANLIAANASTDVGDLYSPLPQSLRGQVDVIVANAPYVPTSSIPTLPAEARLHEPLAALDGGLDGTAVQRRIALEAPVWLASNGVLLIETSAEQADLTHGHMRDAGLVPEIRSDDEREAVVVVGTYP